MRYGFINNFSQALAADLAAGATTLTLDGGVAQLADASPDYRYKLTLIQRDAFGTETHREIVDVTGAAGDDLIIVREQEDTTQLAPWPSGTKVEARMTAGLMGNLAQPADLALFTPELDMTDGGASISVSLPGRAFIDSIEVVSTTDNVPASGWLAIGGTPAAPGVGHAVAWHPSGTYLAVAHATGDRLMIIDTSDWSVVAGTPTLPNTGRAIAWSPSGAYLAVGHGDSSSGDVVIIDTSDWSVVAGTPSISNQVRGLSWAPGSDFLAVAHYGGDRLLIIDAADWSAVTGTPVLPGNGEDVAWSPNGNWLAAGHWSGEGYGVFDTSDWSAITVPSITGEALTLGWRPDSGMLALGHWGGDSLTVIDTSAWSVVAGTPALPGDGKGIAWHPTDTLLAVTHENSTDGWMLIDTTDWSVVGDTLAISGSMGRTAWRPNGEQLAIGHWDEPRLTIVADGEDYPTINIGESDQAPSSLVAGGQLADISLWARTVFGVQAAGLTSLYATPSKATDTGGKVRVVARGYWLPM